MKKAKKMLGFCIILCMILQIIPCIPASAARAISSMSYIVNDQFASGTDGWVAGAGDSAPTITQAATYIDKDGVRANGLLKIDFTGTGGDWNSSTNQTAHRAFGTPYTYKDNTKVVIKTRILQTGDGSGTFSFLHNKPNTTETGVVPGGYANADPYDAIRSGAYYYNDYLLFYPKKDASSSDIRYGTNSHDLSGNILNTATADNLMNRWIDVTMIIDGKNNTMSLRASANGKTALTQNVNITQNDAVYRNKYGTDGNGDPNQRFFSALESLSIQQRNSANTVYVDYIEVYEQTDEFILNDEFTSGTDGWVAGIISQSANPAPDSASISNVASYTDANGVTANGVLRVDMTNAPNEYSVGAQPNIFRALDEPYTYQANRDLVIKTRVLHTANASGKFYLMHNRKNTLDTDTTGASITGDNSYKGHYVLFGARGDQNKVLYPNGFSGDTVTESSLLSASSLSNKWMDVTMVIDGVNDQMTITTTVDGQTATETTSIKQPNKVYMRDGADPGTGWTTPLQDHWDTLDSLTFLQRLGNDTLYIDYVKVYEEIGATMSVNPTYAQGSPITVTFDTNVGTSAFRDAVELYDAQNNKVTTVNTIDATNKIVTMTPQAALTDGAEYTVKVKDGVLPSIYYISETRKSFEVTALEYIINDNFSLGTDGWVAGAGDSAPMISNAASYTDEDGVTASGLLKIEFTGTGGDWNSKSNQTAHRAFGTPYTYKDDVKVVVKTRILQTGDGSGTFSFLHNKPNTTTTDAVAGNNASPNNAIRAGAYYYNDYLLFYAKKDGSSSDLRYGTGYNPSGNILNTQTADNLTNRWIDVEMVIDGRNNTMTMKATADGTTETVKNINITQDDKVYKNKYGTDANGDPTQRFFSALESLSIQQRNSANTVYVDYVKVYEQEPLPAGVILDDQFNSDTDGWVVGAIDSSKTTLPTLSRVASYTDANGVTANGVLKFEVTGDPTSSYVGGQPNIYKAFDTPYTYQDDVNVVIKTRVLHTGDGSGKFYLMHNRKNTIDTSTTGNSITDQPWQNHYELFDVDGSNDRINYPSGVDGTNTNKVNETQLISNDVSNKWIDVTATIDGKNSQMIITATVDGRSETAVADITQPKSVYVRQYGATQASGWIEPPQYIFDALESLTFLQMKDTDTIYIDYVKVYEESVYSCLVDEYGNPVTHLTENTTVYPKFVINPQASGEGSYDIISARYVDGKLVEVHKETVSAGDVYTDDEGYDLGSDVAGVEIKTFIWIAGTMEPACEARSPESGYSEIYVESEENGGSDLTGDGTESAPYASLSQAVNAAYNTNGTVILGGGDYYIDNTINVRSASGKSTTIRAAEGEDVNISVGVKYELDDAVKVTDSAITSRLYDQSAANNLYVLDLTSKLSVSDIPAIAYPGSYDINDWIEPDLPKTTCDVIMGDQMMTVARYPNNSYMKVDKVDHEGSTSGDVSDPFVIRYPSASDPYYHGATWAQAAQAADAKNQPLMFGYWGNDWATQTVPITSVNTSNFQITAGHPSRFGVKKDQRFYVFNLLEEIDAPYEYFIDRTTGKLYFYKPSGLSDDTPIVLTLKKSAFNITADHTTIDGINILGAASTGITVNANDVHIGNCEISNTAGYAIGADGSGIVIENCTVHDTNGGISLKGGDLETLTRSGNIVRNCEVYDFSRLNKTYRSAIHLIGVGNTAEHNEVHGGEHRAMDFSGCYNKLRYNEIYNVCTEVDDAGAIYVGRTWIDRGNEITDNYFHDIASSIDTPNGVGAIFLDDHYAAAYIKGNVFENIEDYAVRGHGGREHTITNNVFVNCTTGVKISNPPSDCSVQMDGLDNSYYQTSTWQAAFPALYNIKNNYPTQARNNSVTKNLYVRCGTASTFGNQVTSSLTNSNNYTTASDPGFSNMAGRNYAITGSAVSGHISGFADIDFGNMGRN